MADSDVDRMTIHSLVLDSQVKFDIHGLSAGLVRVMDETQKARPYHVMLIFKHDVTRAIM